MIGLAHDNKSCNIRRVKVGVGGDLSCTNNKLNRLKAAVELNKYVFFEFYRTPIICYLRRRQANEAFACLCLFTAI